MDSGNIIVNLGLPKPDEPPCNIEFRNKRTAFWDLVLLGLGIDSPWIALFCNFPDINVDH